MKSKEDVLEEIANSGEAGLTITEIFGRKKEELEKGKEILGELIDLGKVIRVGNRFFLSGTKPGKRKMDYITRDEFYSTMNEIRKDIAILKEQIDRAFEYIDEVFIYLKEENSSLSEKTALNVKDLFIAYENARIKNHIGDEVPVDLLKKELKKRDLKFSDKEFSKKLKELDEKEVVYLRKTEKGTLCVVWLKRNL